MVRTARGRRCCLTDPTMTEEMLPLDLLDDFPDHPFRVRMDEDMEELAQSVRERGVMTPLLVRPKEDGRYEIISGHRRKKACELADIREVPCKVREMSRDEAIICMVDSNLQRSRILPSEKAFSYRMRLEAMKRQGMRTDLTSRPLGTKLTRGRSDQELAEVSDDSARQIQRYIRLTNLVPGLLQMVDEEKIALRPAVELSYLSPFEQMHLMDEIRRTDATPSYSQACRMRKLSQRDGLSRWVIGEIMEEEKANQKDTVRLRYEDLRQYIPPNVPYEKTGEYILKAVSYYCRQLERYRQRQQRDDRGEKDDGAR